VPGKTHPTGRARRRQTPAVQQVRRRSQTTCAGHEDRPVGDAPLYQLVPDRVLQRLCIFCVTAMFLAAAACASIFAIAVGSLPTPVAAVLPVLAGASVVMVGCAFNGPRRRRKEKEQSARLR
jgi:hypothetical protein